MRTYTESYTYDEVGNLTLVGHVASGGNWSRGYHYATDGNRLLSTSLPGDTVGTPATYSATYTHDDHGNMTAMPHLSAIDWDHAQRMQHADLGGGGDVWFQYDAAGNRVRKVQVNSAGTAANERMYLGGVEVYRQRDVVSGALDAVNDERETLHIADDAGRVVMVETLTIDGGTVVSSPANVARYQYGNHLGTVALELDDSAAIISYEEFHPYGTSAYRAVDSTIGVSAKRYRYAGLERDEETGLDHMGARYYAPWLGRWTASDPIGLAGGINQHEYAASNPIRLSDPSGTAPGSSTDDAQSSATGGEARSTPDGAFVSNPDGTISEGVGPANPGESVLGEQEQAAAQQRALAAVEPQPPTERELRAEGDTERAVNDAAYRERARAERAAMFRPGAHVADAPSPVAVGAARQALGVAVATRQLAVSLFSFGFLEVVLSTPEERDAAGTAGATLTTLAATAAAAASVKSSGGPAKPNTESYGNFGLSQAEIDQALGGNYRVPPAAKGGVRLGQQERIDLFYKNLGEAQAVATADEAHSLLSRTLTSVEDAHSGVSAVAEPGLKYTGRMYPPREDFMTRLPNGDIEALTKGQRILFGRDGSIQIFSRKTGDRIFNKDGGG